MTDRSSSPRSSAPERELQYDKDVHARGDRERLSDGQDLTRSENKPMVNDAKRTDAEQIATLKQELRQWQAAFHRLGHVLNIESKEHGDLVEALGVELDPSSIESDESFHARALARIAELKASASPSSLTAASMAKTRLVDLQQRIQDTNALIAQMQRSLQTPNVPRSVMATLRSLESRLQMLEEEFQELASRKSLTAKLRALVETWDKRRDEIREAISRAVGNKDWVGERFLNCELMALGRCRQELAALVRASSEGEK